MTDKPSAGPSGDAEFQRWFAEQDPFGNSKEKRQIEKEQDAQGRPSTPRVFRFGVALPAAVVIVGVLALAFVAGTMIRGLH